MVEDVPFPVCNETSEEELISNNKEDLVLVRSSPIKGGGSSRFLSSRTVRASINNVEWTVKEAEKVTPMSSDSATQSRRHISKEGIKKRTFLSSFKSDQSSASLQQLQTKSSRVLLDQDCDDKIGRGNGVETSTQNLYASLVLEHKSTSKLRASGVADPVNETIEDTIDMDTEESHDVNITIPDKEQDIIKPPLVSYELFMWLWFGTLTILVIVDRFKWNVWPRQTYSIGAGGAGNDRTEGFKPGPWSVVLYDVIARISGRYSIICYNFLLLTRMESLEDFFFNSFISRKMLDCTNIVNSNLRLHKYNGIALCVLTLLHVWSILFPCIFHGYSATVVPGNFEYPLSERTPTKCSVEDVDGCWPGDANVELKQMGLQVDDVFRMVEMTIFLAILLPISVRWLSVHWHAAIQLHRIINIVYFVDIVRRHSHPHSWILNTPIYVLYLIDRVVYSNHWHRNDSPPVKKVILSEDFIVLYFKSKTGVTCTNTIGPDYALKLKNSAFLEEKHVFTCFEKRCKAKLGDESDDFDWNVGLVVRVFRRNRIPTIMTDKKSHTERIYHDERCDMIVTGPRQGEMSESLRYALCIDDDSPLVIIAAGSAINYMIDTLQFAATQSTHRPNVSLLYSTRDLDLFEWTFEAISSLISLCEDNGFNIELKVAYTGKMEKAVCKLNNTVSRKTLTTSILSTVSAASTSVGRDIGQDRSDTVEDGKKVGLRSSLWFEGLATHAREDHEFVTLLRSRIDLYECIKEGSTVFCQGSAGLKAVTEQICLDKGATCYLGRGGSREDQV